MCDCSVSRSLCAHSHTIDFGFIHTSRADYRPGCDWRHTVSRICSSSACLVSSWASAHSNSRLNSDSDLKGEGGREGGREGGGREGEKLYSMHHHLSKIVPIATKPALRPTIVLKSHQGLHYATSGLLTCFSNCVSKSAMTRNLLLLCEQKMQNCIRYRSGYANGLLLAAKRPHAALICSLLCFSWCVRWFSHWRHSKCVCVCVLHFIVTEDC